jgi:nucleoside-diphosphate-sugar epimerase
MRSLVTGGAGFIGSALARALCARGDEVVVFDNFLTGRQERVPSQATTIEADLRDARAVARACEGMDVVFHLAAVRSILRSVDDPSLSTECNVLGTLNVLMGASAARVRRVVYASSSSVYGDVCQGSMKEDVMPRPISPYAASKLAGEHYCRVWTGLHGVSTVCLRYFNVFGPGQDPESRYSNAFPAFVEALLGGRSPELHGDGEQSRDFTFIDDVVRANLLAAGADARVDGKVVNVGTGRAQTINAVLHAIAKAVGTWIEPTKLPKRPGDVRHTKADIEQARALLDWRPLVRWDVAVARTIEWFRGRNERGRSQRISS